MSDAIKVRNYNLDDSQNMNWAKLLLRLNAKKEGQFRTIDGKPVFMNGPSSGGGGASEGTLPSAVSAGENIETLSTEALNAFLLDGVSVSDNVVSLKDRTGVKADIIDILSERTGIAPSVVNEVVGTWAHSSNDERPDSLVVQQEASGLFGVPLSSWQNERIAQLGKVEPVSFSRNDAREVLKAMYEHTQEKLVQAGIPERVTLYRGVSGFEFPQGTVQKITTNTLSSFTTNIGTARNFTGDLWDSGALLQVSVPRSRILATARTGFGCLTEFEIVIIGNNTGKADSAYILESD